ncbi:ATP-binding cassette domain-containing protein [Hymenobacter ginsengisoli]|uniref:ATP-binding cassette domain-containing protein n=1 Tax=Hymenobacter ginsengisoli TaxID=1051626 RepID=A0ABP8Q8V9_9BACT|nr:MULTISPECIES: ABC transporter ATP-binding protein [unclassified Hymenobacter]MBO2033645.1 ABC transporter ATP-binding protein [Hymenobacter sp. BT559]
MVRIRNLHFGYSRRVPQLEDLRLDLVRGRIYGLLGKNGAGKSTLLKNMVGLAFPQAGTCEIEGQAASRRLPATLEDLFFLPEDVQAPPVSATQLAASTGVFYPRFDTGAFHTYLRELDVPAHARLTALSFGQQKKVFIAFALATNTGLLVLDEPTNGLDIPSKMQFRKLVAGALGEDRCIVISTHQVRDLDSLIDTVLVLHERRIVLSETIDALAEKLYFGPVPAGTASPDVLYAEPSVRGQQAIRPGDGERYTKVDLELLFNALTGPSQAVATYLTHLHLQHEPVR